MSFFRPTYSMKEINEFMSHVQALRTSADKNANNSVLVKLKALMGSYAGMKPMPSYMNRTYTT